MTGGDEVHGGVKFYRGNAAAARNYVEADRPRVDDYYLAEGTGLATHIIALNNGDGVAMTDAGQLDGPAYEQWVAGYDVATGLAKGRLRQDDNALRFVEVVVNDRGPFVAGRDIDLSLAAAEEIGLTGPGTAPVRVTVF